MLSIVIPSYNEEENIANTAKVLSDTCKEASIDYELLFINDGSKDKTFEKIEEISLTDTNVKGISFSRNFGKEAAIFAGLQYSSGDAVIVMDCDLQHPASLIPKMYEKWKEGYEVVEGIKNSRGKEGFLHKMCAGFFYSVMSKLIKMDMKSTSDYKLLDRKVVNVLVSLPEHNTFFRALSFWVGFKTAKLSYDVQERVYGNSKWSFKSLMKYAVSNATGFSTMPLSLITYMGVLSIICGFVLGVETLVRYFTRNALEGFTTVILLILIIGGIIMISLGIIGHYLARIYEEVKGRPKYIVGGHTKNISGNF